jgi:hypothetical protein
MVIGEMWRRLAGLLRRYPSYPQVIPMRRALPLERLPPVDPTRPIVAIQCLEDPLYFALLAAIYLELRRQFGLRGELVLVHSISGAIGVGLRASLMRSFVLRWPLSMRWVRAFRPLVERVGYRTVSMGRPVGDLVDALRSVAIWLRCRGSTEDFALTIRGIWVGDLIIDSFLRFRPAPRFDPSDPFVLRLIWQAHRDVRRADAYFGGVRPALYLTSYSTYLEHGIPVRVALRHGVAVRSFGSLVRQGKSLTLQDWFHTPNTDDYRRRFASLENPEARLQEAEKQLCKRFAGALDPAMSYMRSSAYADTQEDAPPDLAGAVVIFLHDFYDSPHIYAELVFQDFWSWVCFTIDTLSAAGVPYFLKPHPNQIELSDVALGELRKRYPQARFVSAKVPNSQLVQAGMRCGVTMYGSVAHELAYFGVPTIACARHPHHAFDFCRTARTRQQYRHFLESSAVVPCSASEMRRQALMFYYMQNLHGEQDELDLRSAFIAFWKACHRAGEPDATLLQSFERLRGARAFGELIESLAADTAQRRATLSEPQGA